MIWVLVIVGLLVLFVFLPAYREKKELRRLKRSLAASRGWETRRAKDEKKQWDEHCAEIDRKYPDRYKPEGWPPPPPP